MTRQVLGQTEPNDVGSLGQYKASLVLLAKPAALFVIFGLRFIVNRFTAVSTL